MDAAIDRFQDATTRNPVRHSLPYLGEAYEKKGKKKQR